MEGLSAILAIHVIYVLIPVVVHQAEPLQEGVKFQVRLVQAQAPVDAPEKLLVQKRVFLLPDSLILVASS